jgi:hypothetical protein
MKSKTPNPFNISLSKQEHFVLRSTELNYTQFGLATTRYFEVYSEDMKHLGCITCECSEEHGHKIVGNTLSRVWEEAVDCVTEKDFRAAVANTVAIFKTQRFY